MLKEGAREKGGRAEEDGGGGGRLLADGCREKLGSEGADEATGSGWDAKIEADSVCNEDEGNTGKDSSGIEGWKSEDSVLGRFEGGAAEASALEPKHK